MSICAFYANLYTPCQSVHAMPICTFYANLYILCQQVDCTEDFTDKRMCESGAAPGLGIWLGAAKRGLGTAPAGRDVAEMWPPLHH